MRLEDIKPFKIKITDGVTTEEVEFAPVKHGEWMLDEYPDGYYHAECTECWNWVSEDVYWEKKTKYCPHCGAKMDGDADA